MNDPGIYVVHYTRGDGRARHVTIESQCSLAALGIVVEAERQSGHVVANGRAEFLCPSRLLNQ